MEDGAAYSQLAEGTLSNLLFFFLSNLKNLLTETKRRVRLATNYFSQVFEKSLLYKSFLLLFLIRNVGDLLETKVIIFEIDLWVTHSVCCHY